MKLHKFRPKELDKLVSESVKNILQPDLLQHQQNNIYLMPYIINNMDTYLRMSSMKLVPIEKIITHKKNKFILVHLFGRYQNKFN